MSYRTCKCANPYCKVVFTTTHPFKKYHSKRCRILESSAKRADMYRRMFRMSERAYRARQDVRKGFKQPFKPHRSPGMTVDEKVKGKAFSLPRTLIQRMKNFPHVNWSGEVSKLLDKRLLELELV